MDNSFVRVGLVLALTATTLQTPLLSQNAPGRLVAIGDIHGSFDGFTAILRKTGLVDEQMRWAGGRTVFVQTGDFTDRGPDVRKVMDLLMQLEKEAKAAGGQAIVLAGNHEVMNMIGDLRDVTPQICAAFATPQSESRREKEWDQYERLSQSRARVLTPPPAVYSQSREAWTAAHPLGCLEYREAMGPGGTYGKWLRDKDIAAVVNGTLFMHAGLNPSRDAPKSIDDVNDRARSEVRRFDGFRNRLVDRRMGLPSFSLQNVVDVAVAELTAANASIEAAKARGSEPPQLDLFFLREAQALAKIPEWSLIDPEGPLWFRGYATWSEADTAAQVTAFLDQMKLARIVVGHTPTVDRRIGTRYGGRVITIDTGMLASHYKGKPSALEIVEGRIKAIYPDGEAELTAAAKAAEMLLF
jgi:hypothetical protein